MSKITALRDYWPQRDPRTRHLPLAGNAYFLTSVLLTYIFIVKFLGPRFMRNRKPYENLKPWIRAFNLIQVVANLYSCCYIVRRTWLSGRYSLICQGIDYTSTNETDLEVLDFHWWYLWLRIFDFCDTFFFILRKKDRNVSFLHVAHHCIVVFMGWFGVGYGSDGQTISIIIFNAFVHVVMYTYYFLSSFGPAMQPYLFWKRYLTRLQIVQFVLMFMHALFPLFMSCNYPRMHSFIIISANTFFFVMFAHFYVLTYRRSTKLKSKTDAATTNGFRVNGTVLKKTL